MDEELQKAIRDSNYLKAARILLRAGDVPRAYGYAVQAFEEAGGHRSCLGNNPKCEGRVFCDDEGYTQYNYLCLPENAKEAHTFIEIVRKSWEAWEKKRNREQSQDQDWWLRNPDALIPVFCYGSNNPTQLTTRLGYRPRMAGAFLKDYQRIFVGFSQKWNGGVGSLEKTKGKIIYGLVAYLTKEDIKQLDRFEGWKPDNSGSTIKKNLKITLQEDDTTTVKALVYLGTSKVRNRPSQAYLEAIAETISAFWSGSGEGPVTWRDITVRNPDNEEQELRRKALSGDLKAAWRLSQSWARRGLLTSQDLTRYRIFPGEFSALLTEWSRVPEAQFSIPEIHIIPTSEISVKIVVESTRGMGRLEENAVVTLDGNTSGFQAEFEVLRSGDNTWKAYMVRSPGLGNDRLVEGLEPPIIFFSWATTIASFPHEQSLNFQRRSREVYRALIANLQDPILRWIQAHQAELLLAGSISAHNNLVEEHLKYQRRLEELQPYIRSISESTIKALEAEQRLDLRRNPSKKTLYHGTSTKVWEEIQLNGLQDPCLTSDLEVAEYFAEETSEKDGSSPIILEVETETSGLKVDYPAFEEPLTFWRDQFASNDEEWFELLEKGEEIGWPEDENDWETSLDITTCVKYSGNINQKLVKPYTLHRNPEEKNFRKFRILAQQIREFPELPPQLEIIGSADSQEEADYLVKEYKLVYGVGWRVWHERKGLNQKYLR